VKPPRRDDGVRENAGAMKDRSTSTAAPDAATARPKVVYVMGSGRSGSTILGVALGNCDGVFYAGELDNWLVRSGTPVLGGLERTRFWGTVRDDVASGRELFGNRAQRDLERSFAPFRVHRLRARRQLRERYRRVTDDLYRAIARAAGVTHVIDTSHFPLRARELQALAGIDLYLILLVRDPRSVVDSFNLYLNRNDVAERRLRVLSTNANLWLTHLLSVLVFLRQPRERRMLLRHEEFLANPEGMLREILDRVHCPAALPDLTSLNTGLPLNGNRLLSAEVVSLESQAIAPRRNGLRMTTLLQLPWTAVFSRLRPVASASAPPVPAARTSASHEHVSAS
jgi:Sulfotransferase family